MSVFRLLFFLYLLAGALFPSLQDGAGLDPHGGGKRTSSRTAIRSEEGAGLCPNGGKGSGSSGSGSSGSGSG